MNVWRLIVREIGHRKMNFFLGLVSVAVAVGCLVGAQMLLQADGIVTSEILETKAHQVEQAVAEKQAVVAKAGADLENAIRKQMKGLGFNILIFVILNHIRKMLSNFTPIGYSILVRTLISNIVNYTKRILM